MPGRALTVDERGYRPKPRSAISTPSPRGELGRPSAAPRGAVALGAELADGRGSLATRARRRAGRPGPPAPPPGGAAPPAPAPGVPRRPAPRPPRRRGRQQLGLDDRA